MLKRVYDEKCKDKPKLIRVHSDMGYYSIEEGSIDVKNMIIFHHNDSDGILGGQLFYEAFGFDQNDLNKFFCCNYADKTPNESMIKEGDTVIFVDYNAPLEQLLPIINKAKLVIILDHHKTGMDMIDEEFEYFKKMVDLGKLVIDIDMARCGSKIANDWIIQYLLDIRGKLLWNQKLIYLIDNYDRWTKKDIEADYLNKFIFTASMLYIGSDKWHGFLYDEDYLMCAISIGKKFYDIDIEKNEIIYWTFSKEVEFHGLKIRVIEGYGNSMLFGEHINDYDAVCVYHITKDNRWQYSMYIGKPTDDINISEIARSYGGGGHKNSCGWTIDEKLF